MSLNETPRSNRLHIGIFGKVNSGKSTFLNMMTNQESSLVSKEAGTTSDPVYKAMELSGIGPVVWIDTAGYEDVSKLGEKRLEKTQEAAKKSDIALVLFADEDIETGLQWIQYFQKQNTPVLAIINTYKIHDVQALSKTLEEKSGLETQCIDVNSLNGRDVIRKKIIRLLPEMDENVSITNHLVEKQDVVLLVMPQDNQAPKGRLILPQVQTIRELLDKKCIVISCTMDNMVESLNTLKEQPNLIICDSQIFDKVYERKPKASKLTSFSVLFAQYKGDIKTFIEGAKAIENLNENSRVLIAEACTHAPLSEDIGREKIPAMLKKRIGENLIIDRVSGNDFPSDISKYDLIIHCGGCMFNRKYVINRVEEARKAKVAMTNYGVCIAYLKGILDKIDI